MRSEQMTCNKCDFKTEHIICIPYIEKKGVRVPMVTPAPNSILKKLSGVEHQVYCKNCHQIVTVNERFIGFWKRHLNKLLKKESDSGLCPICHTNDLLHEDDQCPQCKEGTIKAYFDWVS